MSQSFTKPGAWGKVEEGYEAIKDSIRIFSQSENYHILGHFMKISNLKPEHLAASGWGFPIIPIPQKREGYGRIRLAPQEVSRSFIGHPIYWIDPKLTERRMEETWGEWSIRMFFLIDGFGYWTNKLEFVDFLKARGFSFSQDQMEIYHKIASDHSETDKFKMLEESDLETSLDRVEENYRNELARCFEIQEAESLSYIRAQEAQYKFALSAIGKKRLRDWTLNFDDPGSVWDKQFDGELMRISQEYDKRATTGDTRTSDLLSDVRRNLYKKLEISIKKYNHAASILELPVRSSVGSFSSGVELIAQVATDMDVANRDDNIRITVLKEIDKLIERNLVNGNKGVGAFNEIIAAMRREYQKAWRRMRLAVINLENMVYGDVVYATYVELESALQRQNIEESSELKARYDDVPTRDELTFTDLESIANLNFKQN